MCTDCGQTCKSGESLKFHTEANHQKINYMCSKNIGGCGLVFESESLLRKHFQTHYRRTDFTNANILGCTRCDKTFNGKDGLAMHVTSVHKN